VLQVDEDFFSYFIYVYCGMVIWGGLASAVSNLCATLVKNARSITTRSLPIFSYVFEDILISFIPFLLSLPFVFLAVYLSGYFPSLLGLLTFISGFTLVLLASFGFSISVGLSAFFIGDIRQVITAIMRLSFLVTPVIWKAERLNDAQYLLMLNPFYGFLHILRNSLTGEQIEMLYVLQALGVTVFLLIIGGLMFANMRRKIQHRALML
jgi:ABC-type polysaccharide/polyol phosphate export permease